MTEVYIFSIYQMKACTDSEYFRSYFLCLNWPKIDSTSLLSGNKLTLFNVCTNKYVFTTHLKTISYVQYSHIFMAITLY